MLQNDAMRWSVRRSAPRFYRHDDDVPSRLCDVGFGTRSQALALAQINLTTGLGL